MAQFKDQFSLYINDSHGSCIINQPSGFRRASLEHNSQQGSQHDQFLEAVNKGRQLWNTSGYNLWDSFEGEDARQ